MSDYQRLTRVCALAELPAPLAQALWQRAQDQGIQDLGQEALIVCETTSTKIKRSGLIHRLLGGDPDKMHITGIVVTPKQIIWGHHGEKRGTAVLSAKFSEVRITAFASTLVADTGLEVSGFISGFNEKAQAFIGLGEGAAADQLRQLIAQVTGE